MKICEFFDYNRAAIAAVNDNYPTEFLDDGFWQDNLFQDVELSGKVVEALSPMRGF
jgi:hypothetical protein